MQRYLLSLVLLVIAGIQVASAASDVPDLKGVWILEGGGVRHVHHEGKEAQLESKYAGVTEGTYELADQKVTIDKQDGYRFSGIGESKNSKVKISGVIGFDNKSIYAVREHATAFCQLASADKIECVELASRKHHAAAFRGVLVREKK